jgi:hypothetical protein
MNYLSLLSGVGQIIEMVKKAGASKISPQCHAESSPLIPHLVNRDHISIRHFSRLSSTHSPF